MGFLRLSRRLLNINKKVQSYRQRNMEFYVEFTFMNNDFKVFDG